MSGLLDSFLGRATLGGIAVALAAAPLGCFVVWRRMAYFGDATAHAALLGVAGSLIFAIPPMFGVLLIAFCAAALVTFAAGQDQSSDTLLGVMSHGALALGLMAAAMVPNRRMNLESWLFGDILAISRLDVLLIWGGAILVLVILAWRWSALLTATLNPGLAQAAGLSAKREEVVLVVTLALTVAVAIKVVGALLIGALLLIPAASARPFARTPESMAALAIVVGCASVLGGLALSWHIDTPTGPSIVTVGLGIFLCSQIVRLIRPAR